MNNLKTFYWSAQAVGWMVYMVIIMLFGFLGGNLNAAVFEAAIVLWFIGIFVSHMYRLCILRWGWLTMPIVKVIPLIFLASGICAVFYFLLEGLWFDTFIDEIAPLLTNNWNSNIQLVINLWVLFLIWSIIYFSVFYFMNYKRQEIETLKFQAAAHEMELNNLKAQLNPHFMFNAMNSIRALVDENPAEAKNAVTQLSTLLRSTLMHGKKSEVTLSEEMQVVKNYLSLEQIRYEERLTVKIDVDPRTLEFTLPPIALQTLVENAIKHGIANRTSGGEIIIHSKVGKKAWELSVANTGKLESERSEGTGIGIINTRKRLKLMYGNKAKLKLENQNDMVVAKLIIPLNDENKSTYN